MRIQCPECEAKLSLGQPKAGNYRPTCKHCQRPFRLKITDGTPPRALVARDKQDVASDGSSSHADSVESTRREDREATIDCTAASSGFSESCGTSDETNQDPRQTTGAATDKARQAGSLEPIPWVASGRSKSVPVSPAPDQRKASERNADARAADDEPVPERLGGYRILKLLGRGAMGAVYEAKQVSLDRQVALKTIRGRLAENPASLARFAREAYAAAQLSHHNVVQIYDFGEDAGRHFFSMEWVKGGPLDALIRDRGPLEARVAASYTLQAARGLQFAHRNGMVHRDVKPANLLLSDEGVIKVADLGLVKIPDQGDVAADAYSMSGLASGTQVTMQGTAVGTPAYMAPEQGVDAAAVDHRADIYSLGCTLFYMLSGKPPFDGTVVSAVMEQHANQAIPDLADFSSRVPKTLQTIMARAMAKRPEDRYASLSEMVSALESFLGVSRDGKFTPTTTQADQWEDIAARYRKASAMQRWTDSLLLALSVIGGFLTVLLLFVGLRWMLFGPTLFVTSVSIGVLLGNALRRSPLVSRLRAWVSSLSWMDRLMAVVGGLVMLIVMVTAGMMIGVMVGLLLGAALGVAFHFLVAVPSCRSARTALEDAERFVRDLRIEGADEEGIRQFAARYAGRDWQRLYEDLFGYDDLCEVRMALQMDPSFTGSTKSDRWRDRLCATLLQRTETNRAERDRQQLAEVEELGLKSQGLTPEEARDRAWQMAAAVMDNAKLPIAMKGLDADNAAKLKRERMKMMLADARSGNYRIQRDRYSRVRWLLGGHIRLLAGCLLLVLFALWGNQNGVFESFKQLDTLQDFQAGEVDLDEVGDAIRGAAETGSAVVTNETGNRVSGWSLGVSGLLLVLSAFVSGWRMTPFALVATIVILFGPLIGIPGVGDRLQPWMVAALVGVALYIPGILIGEANEES